MPLVAGIDSSTQACKVVVLDADTGVLLREGRAAHPEGTEVDPEHWWRALEQAVHRAGGFDDVGAVAVAGQQHGMVCLDADGAVVRPALLWNDTRSAAAAGDLVAELGGAQAWAEAVGSVPVASFTVTKLRWLAEHEAANAARTATVCLPHDWLTWRLSGRPSPGELSTDRGDASGTGYYSAASGHYRDDLLELALGHEPAVPRVLGPNQPAGYSTTGALLGPGTGDNAAAALGVGAGPGDVLVSVGTSGVVCAVAEVPANDPAGASPGSPTPPAGSCRWSARSTRPGCWTRRPACSGWSTQSCPGGPCRPLRERTVWWWCPTWRVSARPTGRTRPVRCTG